MYGEFTSPRKPSGADMQAANRVDRCNGGTTRKLSRVQRLSSITPLGRILPDRLLNKADEEGEPTNLKNASSLKTAFCEFYLMLILLQKFQLLNFTGFRKILKKHDKLFQTTRGEEWR